MGTMKRHIAITIRKQSWIIAALFLIASCWLGFVAAGFGVLFKGIEMNFPVATRFDVVYGPVAFPLFGIVAATAFILSDVLFRKRWLQVALTASFALLVIWAVRGLFVGGVFIVPAIRAN
jgi:hypothetical protein